ncbi:winged helix-turn-helix transcriptional regulator [Chitinophaga sp. GCM10012297]|uniref:Helix-turn-helix transcriptional regulator n=1 Tax=Chitinophaga chungangae TaxID=2821488 RepID=A0ABS3Y9H5_9BACT|nr:helix-turn-helix domain-containing protein [Chitinophaga chungangae]MBO9151335.1 helix-turn-helix transcriptional regulator [Chitinophaga chungangae]
MSYQRIPTLNCETNPDADCSVEAALAVLGGKWKLKIYKIIRANEVMRFNELAGAIGRISDKTLAAQLKEMEADGLLIRRVYPEVPPRVEYCLTELGRSLAGVFSALEGWGRQYLDQAKLRKVS